MTYPTILMIITFGAFFGLMFFVVPTIGKILLDLGGPDAKLPALTQVMLAISAFMLNFWYIVIWQYYRHSVLGFGNIYDTQMANPSFTI